MDTVQKTWQASKQFLLSIAANLISNVIWDKQTAILSALLLLGTVASKLFGLLPINTLLLILILVLEIVVIVLLTKQPQLKRVDNSAIRAQVVGTLTVTRADILSTEISIEPLESRQRVPYAGLEIALYNHIADPFFDARVIAIELQEFSNRLGVFTNHNLLPRPEHPLLREPTLKPDKRGDHKGWIARFEDAALTTLEICNHFGPKVKQAGCWKVRVRITAKRPNPTDPWTIETTWSREEYVCFAWEPGTFPQYVNCEKPVA